MSYEAEVREHAKELGYRLIKIPNTDRYNLADNSWWGKDLNQVEEELDRIEQEIYGDDDEEDEQPAPPPTPAEIPVAVPAKPIEADLDAEIAAMTEKIRVALWLRAAREWWCHYVDDESPPSIDLDSVDAVCPAFAYAWQKAIDSGHAAPVEEEWPSGNPNFPVPTLDWIGLGLDWDARGVVWEDVWDYLEVVISGVMKKTIQLERQWVEREVRNELALDEKIDSLFDEDGNWKSEDQVTLVWNSNAISVPKPTFFTDLVMKVDRRGAPDYADGWWNEEETR